MKIAHRIAAEALLVLHILLVLLVAFGWLVPSLWYVYIGSVIAILISDITLGYCLLSKWEFDLRHKHEPGIDYDYAWTSYYTYKFTNYRISNDTYWYLSIFFLGGSLVLGIYFHYFI